MAAGGGQEGKGPHIDDLDKFGPDEDPDKWAKDMGIEVTTGKKVKPHEPAEEIDEDLAHLKDMGGDVDGLRWARGTGVLHDENEPGTKPLK